jgi:hypothetical protein
MDENQKQNITQASEQLTDSAQQSFQMLADRTVALQESNLKLTQNFFHNWIEQVNNQAQGTREATQNLAEQGQRQREAVETLSSRALRRSARRASRVRRLPTSPPSGARGAPRRTGSRPHGRPGGAPGLLARRT